MNFYDCCWKTPKYADSEIFTYNGNIQMKPLSYLIVIMRGSTLTRSIRWGDESP